MLVAIGIVAAVSVHSSLLFVVAIRLIRGFMYIRGFRSIRVSKSQGRPRIAEQGLYLLCGGVTTRLWSLVTGESYRERV